MSEIATVITPDGKTTKIELPANNKKESKQRCEKLWEIVGGYFDAVPGKGFRTIYCHDEGKLKGLPVNQAATDLLHPDYAGTFLVGTVVVVQEMNILKRVKMKGGEK